jgi:arginyl-tRNA synthetase
VQLTQLVKLFRGGEPVQMSKRSGEFVTMREVVEEVGPGSVRFMMLFRKADAPLDFDLRTVKEQSKDNPRFLRAIRACAHRLGPPSGRC